MSYYRLDFRDFPAEEADRWSSKPTALCSACGLRVVPVSAEFPVSDDQVAHVHVGVWEWIDNPLLEVGSVLLARADFALQLATSGLGGFSFRSAEITYLEATGERPLPDYSWMVVEGRCHLHDIWTRVLGVCRTCGYPTIERLAAQHRRVRLRQPLPAASDVCRGRESAGGVIVTDRFRGFCQSQLPGINELLHFAPVPVEPE